MDIAKNVLRYCWNRFTYSRQYNWGASYMYWNVTCMRHILCQPSKCYYTVSIKIRGEFKLLEFSVYTFLMFFILLYYSLFIACIVKYNCKMNIDSVGTSEMLYSTNFACRLKQNFSQTSVIVTDWRPDDNSTVN